MHRIPRILLFFGPFFVFQVGLLCLIPLLRIPVFLSPDETANAAIARQFAVSGSVRIAEPLLQPFPWLHPRSLVGLVDVSVSTPKADMVPVAFLGMPVLLGIAWKLGGDLLMLLLTPLLAASVLYPLFRWTKSWSFVGRLAVLTSWLAFPSVIMYANRGLFPNLVVVCLTLWSVFLVWERQSLKRSLASGIVFGLALAVRPIELAWMLPWIVLGWRYRLDRDTKSVAWIWTLLGMACVGSLYLILNAQTYGNLFTIGYWVRDLPIGVSSPLGTSGPLPLALRDRWPFGFHPMHVWFNVRSYLFCYLWPWMLVAFGAAVISWKERSYRALSLVGVWTVTILSVVYGQAVYQDHIGLNVISSGNSFLRYLLPLAPFAALSAGACVDWLIRHFAAGRGKCAAVALTIFLVCIGMWTAFVRDDEGVGASMRQLRDYAQLRSRAIEALPQDAIVLSERSDKIFFPQFRAVSPLPAFMEIRRLLQMTSSTVAFYGRILDATTTQQFAQESIVTHLVFNAEQNMGLYVLSLSQP